MQHSKIFASAFLALISALVLVHASQYGGNNNKGAYGPAQGGQYNSAAGCQGYQCTRQVSRSPYGPYHSYAVRPVVYGGYGLYHYKGYARHAPAPAAYQQKQRHPRSHGAGPARRRPSRGACHGRYCGQPQRHYAAPQRHYAPAASAHRRPQATSSYGMRPVMAVALTPSSNGYNSRPAYGQQQQQYNGAHGRQQDGYRQQAASYGGGNGSNQYASGNDYGRQQHGYKQAGGQRTSAGGY